MNPPHLAAQRPQYSQQHPPSQTRPMVPPQNPTRPPPPRPQDQLRPNHQQNSQQPMPANQHSPQLAYQQRPHPVSPQMNPRPYSPQMQPRPPQLQRPPPSHAFSPRPNTLNQPQSSPQYRPEVIHPRPALPPLAPIVPVVSTQEASHHPVPNLINKAQTRTLGAQQGPSKSTDDTNDASSLFGAISASASEKAALPSADVLFGSGPSSMDFFRQPPATIKYAPIQRRSMDTHRHPDKSTATSQQDVDSLFSSPTTAATITQQDVGSLFSSPATVTVTKQQDVGPQFASSVTMAAATIHHQETHSGIMLPQIESISRITSPFRSADIFSLGGFQDSRSSQPAPIFDPPTAVSQSTDVSAESNAFSSATPQRASPTNHYEAPLSPTGPVVSALNNNNRGSFDVGLNVTDTKVSQALHHQDSSSLFGGSDDTDASRFFSGPSAMDSSAFFSGLSQPGASAAHIGNASSTTAKANNDAIQPIFSPVLLSSAETGRTVELVARRDLEPTPASRPPAQSAAAAVTGSAADLFGQPSPQDFFSSSFFKNSENQGASETTAIVEASTANLHRTIFSNLERSTVDRADAGSNSQLKETQHDTNTMSSTHVLPVSLRESQRPPHSFRDAPSSQRHDKPQVPVYLQHSSESDHTTSNAHGEDSLFEQPLGSEPYQAPHQHIQHEQLAQAQASSDTTQPRRDAQGVDDQSVPISEEAKPSHVHDHQSEDFHQQDDFASPVQELPHHAPSFITQELHRHQESVSGLFSHVPQPFGLDSHGSDDRQPSISDLFSQPPQAQALDINTPKNRQQSVSDLFDMSSQTFAVKALRPEGRQQSVSDLFDVVPRSFAFDNPESENHKQSFSGQLNQEPQPFTVDNTKSEDRQESASNQLHKVSQAFSFGNQEPTSFDLLGTTYTQEISTFDLLGTSHTQGRSPFDLLGTPNTQGESLDLFGTSDVQERFPFDLPETSKIQGESPFDLLGTSNTQGGSPFDTVEPQSNDLPMEPSSLSQDPGHRVVGAPTSAPPEDQQRTRPAVFSFNSQFEEADNSFSLSDQAGQPLARPPQPSSSPPSQQGQPQPIPFDETLSGPASPGFGRNATESFVTHDIHAAEAIVQPGSYSIMELSSELAHTPYFSQAKESPRLQERANWSKAVSGSGASELSQGISPKMEVETSVFDQVSLAEDAPGTVLLSTNLPSATSPPKERGLASLLDPSTLSAVEDLLNMPKSAAFERGMSRLFKGVKSSATSMFNSPLGQSPSKSLASLGASSADAATPATDDIRAVLGASVSGMSAQPRTAKPAPAPATTTAPPAAAVLPPPPRRTQEKDHSNLPPPPRISNWPAAPDAAGALATAAAPLEASKPVRFDWAHKQSSIFLETTEEAVPEPSKAIESFSSVGREEPPKEDDDVSTTLPLQSTTMLTPTAPPAFPTTSEQSSHFNHAALSQGSQGDSVQYHAVLQGHDAVDIVVAPEAHVDGGFVEHRETEVISGDPINLGGQKVNAHMERESPNVAVSKQGLELTSPTAPHHTASPTVHHHLAASPTIHPQTVSPAIHYNHQQAVNPTLHNQPASPTLLQRAVSPILLHHAASPTLLQRATSPSVLDPEVLLRKQAAVHALLADQVAHGGSIGASRTKPDKKERLLEKARELLEKRQQSSGVHLQGANGGHSGPTVQKYSGAGSRSSGEWMRQEESPRRGSLLSRDQFSSPTMSHQSPTLHNGPVTDPVPVPATVPYPPASPSFGSHRRQQQGEQQLQQQQTQQQVDEVTADRHLALENERLREQVQLLLAETRGLQVQIQSQQQLQSQVSRLQEDLTRIHSESQAVEARHQEIRSDQSRRLEDVSLENHRLQAALAQAQSDNHHVGTGMDDLMGRYRQIEADLSQARRVCKEQEIALAEAQKMKEVALENERLQYELDRTRSELQEQRATVTAAAASEISARRTSLGSDAYTHTAEQLLQEAEGLRRQLKGQRQEMKELQDSVKRSDVEKRDLFSRIGQLERALADAEKHRNEQKSHQAMKDEAYKVIQERLVASFEEEKAQYLDEEAFKMAKLEHRYNILQSEMATLRAKEVEKPAQ
ncbi:hypothetical protein BGZ90_004117, partial [Linnemannia elongata]